MAKGATRFSRVLWQVIIALVVFEAGSTYSGAHAVVVDSSPNDKEVLTHAPKEVILHFNAKIEKSLARVSLISGDGRIIQIPAPIKQNSDESSDRLVIPMPHIEPGEYLLRYKVFSIDGHATMGVLRFRIVSGP